MHRTFLLVLAPFALIACDTAPVDSDGDGLTDEEEAAYGTNPNDADSDGDGMKDQWELNLGLDPLNADTDGDGVDDGSETKEGTDPLNAMSWGYEKGDYPVGKCELFPEDLEGLEAGPTGYTSIEYQGENYSWEAYAEGDLIADHELFDSYDQDFSLYAMCGQHVMLIISAAWCGPCKSKAAELPELVAEYADSEFTPVEVLTQDSRGNPSDVDDLVDWRDAYDLDTIPVVAGANNDAYTEMSLYWDLDGGIPSTSLIGPDLRVIAVDDYYIEYDLEDYLTQ